MSTKSRLKASAFTRLTKGAGIVLKTDAMNKLVLFLEQQQEDSGGGNETLGMILDSIADHCVTGNFIL